MQRGPVYVEPNDPNKFNYPDNSFYSYSSRVTLPNGNFAQPTLCPEGEKAVVRSGKV